MISQQPPKRRDGAKSAGNVREMRSRQQRVYDASSCQKGFFIFHTRHV
jgi:hypothetical protein